MKETLLWAAFILGSFLLGSLLFSHIIPRLAVKKDICRLGDDHNPGAANVFKSCGVGLGMICLLLDIFKGFAFTIAACFVLDTESLLFAFLMCAPVLGHALGVFNHLHGGKCISTSFGVMLGIMPISRIGFLLAALYIVFSVLVKINPHSLRSILAFSIFGVSSLIILSLTGKLSVGLGCSAISVIAIVKHIISALRIKGAENDEDKEASLSA